MNTRRFLLTLLGFSLAVIPPVNATTAFRLFEVGIERFVRDSSGQGHVQNGRLAADGKLTIDLDVPTGFVDQVPAAVVGKTLIYTEAWHAYGKLGAEARANFRLANGGAPIVLGNLIYFQVEPHPEARLDVGDVVNLSTRGEVEAGQSPSLIGGFVVHGRHRKVLIRAVGPTLAEYGVTKPLADPYLYVQKGTMTYFFNDNWGTRHNADEIAAAAAEVGAFPLPRTSKDAVLLLEMPPGVYTASVVAENGSPGGTALLEIYVMP